MQRSLCMFAAANLSTGAISVKHLPVNATLYTSTKIIHNIQTWAAVFNLKHSGVTILPHPVKHGATVKLVVVERACRYLCALPISLLHAAVIVGLDVASREGPCT